jgi:hypothetical protein
MSIYVVCVVCVLCVLCVVCVRCACVVCVVYIVCVVCCLLCVCGECPRHMTSLNLAELWLLKQPWHKHGEPPLGRNPKPHECKSKVYPSCAAPLLTLFPPTHVFCEIEGDGRDCCGAISLEGAGECSVDVARARLRDRESRESSSLRQMLSCDCAACMRADMHITAQDVYRTCDPI